VRLRVTAIVVALAAVLAIVLLISSSTGDQQEIAFSIDIDPGPPIAATVLPGEVACQGPIHTIAPAATVFPWLSPTAAPGAAMTLSVRDYASNAVLATGSIAQGYSMATAPGVHLSATIPQGRAISVCLRSNGPKPVGLIGNPPNTRSGQLVVAGQTKKDVMSLLFLRPKPVSLLSQIPTIFSRAALFRPDWVGSWTFWVLAVLLVGAFFGVGYAVLQAEREDARSSEQTSAQ
jgi:hypothetical protein